MDIEQIIIKYFEEGLSAKEREDLKLWLEASEENRVYFQEAVAIWKNAAGPEQSLNLHKMEDRSWASVDKNIAPVPGFPWIRYAAAAVMLIGILAITFRFLQSDEEIMPLLVSTGLGEQKELVLPDSSRLWMNENSELSFLMDGSSRMLTMSGEIYFDIERDSSKSFVIEAGDSRTEVLGTSFNIKTEEDGDVEIRVSSGVVAFSNQVNGEEGIALEKGELAMLSREKNLIIKEKSAVLNTSVWRTRQLTFDNNDLGMLADELIRYMDLDIDFEDPAIANCKITAVIPLDDKALVEDILNFSLGLEIEKMDERRWLLKGESCE